TSSSPTRRLPRPRAGRRCSRSWWGERGAGSARPASLAPPTQHRRRSLPDDDQCPAAGNDQSFGSDGLGQRAARRDYGEAACDPERELLAVRPSFPPAHEVAHRAPPLPDFSPTATPTAPPSDAPTAAPIGPARTEPTTPPIV